MGAAKAAFNQLTTSLEESVATLASGRFQGMKFKKVSDYWHLTGLGPWLTVHWWQQYTNSLDGCPVHVDLFDGAPNLPGIMTFFDKAHRLQALEFDYRLIASDRHGYIQKGNPDRAFSGEELAEHILKLYFDAAEGHKRR